eukprot:1181956-Prorocentrum_minimum.AAC.6
MGEVRRDVARGCGGRLAIDVEHGRVVEDEGFNLGSCTVSLGRLRSRLFVYIVRANESTG